MRLLLNEKGKDPTRPNEVYSDNSRLAHTSVVSCNKQADCEKVTISIGHGVAPTTWARENTSIGEQTELNSEFNSLTTRSKSILEASIRKYSSYLNKWHKFCSEKKLGKNITANHIVNFLGELYDKNVSYSVIKSAKSALSHEICLPPFSSIGEHPLVRKFMKGVYNLRPPKTKCGFIWDVKILFKYFEDLPNNNELDITSLSYKTLCLLVLLSGARVNTVYNFRVDEIVINNVGITITPSELLKHSRQNRKNDIFYYRKYEGNEKLCVVSALQAYLISRKDRVPQSEKQLFITNKKPYRSASIDTLRRWIKTTLNKAGIYNFSPHSCRAAATTKAKKLNVDLDLILKKACWTNAKTFHKFYHKQIAEETEDNFNKIIEKKKKKKKF